MNDTPKQTETKTPPKEKLRAYKIVDAQGVAHLYPSVTSVISFTFGLPQEMMTWVAKNSALRALREQRLAKKEGRKPTQKELVELAKTERFVLLKQAQDKGVQLHQWIEDYFNGKTPTEIPKGYQGYWNSFTKWHSYYQIKPVLQEEVVYSHEYKFAGRMDFYGDWNGKRVLVDWKTSNFLRWDYGLQLAAYKHCLETMGHRVDETYILHLRSHGFYEFVKFDKPFDLFLSARKLFSDKVNDEKPEFELAYSPQEYIEKNSA